VEENTQTVTSCKLKAITPEDKQQLATLKSRGEKGMVKIRAKNKRDVRCTSRKNNTFNCVSALTIHSRNTSINEKFNMSSSAIVSYYCSSTSHLLFPISRWNFWKHSRYLDIFKASTHKKNTIHLPGKPCHCKLTCMYHNAFSGCLFCKGVPMDLSLWSM